MAQHLDGEDGQNLNHLLTSSPWSHTSLFDSITQQCIKIIKQRAQGCYLLIDEVAFRKKGDLSACVGKQYLGCIGTYSNGQVAVTSAISMDNFYCPLEIKLFMPQSWEHDNERRKKAGIPEQEKHESKTEIAREMILRLHSKLPGLRYVVFDSLYGANVNLLYELVHHDIPFVGGTKKSYRFYTKKPRWHLPKKEDGSGPKYSVKQTDQKPIQLQDYIKTLKAGDFQKVNLRKSTKGLLSAKFHLRDVWVLHKETKDFIALQLLLRKDPDGKMYYSLCFSPKKASIKELAIAQAQRVFVERIFEEGKNIVGMADYQVRSWKGFHRHMALCSLSLLFLMKQRILLLPKAGMITAYQIQELIILTIKFISEPKMIILNLVDRINKYQEMILKRKVVT